MALDEIEVQGSSLSLQCFHWRPDPPKELLRKISEQGTSFVLANETPGFYDLDADTRVIKGCYALVSTFEVEHLAEEFTTKSLLKRIESCDFLGFGEYLFVWGKRGPIKSLTQTMSGLTASAVTPLSFDMRELAQFQERLTTCKAIVLTNPKTKELRRCRLAGIIEHYTDYNVIDPLNHSIDSVSGLIDSPLGPMTVTVGHGGNVRFNVKKGFIMTVDCIMWLLALIREADNPGRGATPGGHDKHVKPDKTGHGDKGHDKGHGKAKGADEEPPW